jgi:Mg2+ and Co2+ transporter CorA
VSHTLQMFIHQQDTGRQLVFLLLLGYMCEKLATECDRFMTELDRIMNLNPRVLLEGMEWEKSDRALRRLKQMLWGFEALRIFGDKLKKALDAVLKAGDKAKASLENDKRIRHKDMLSGVEQVKEEYDKRHNRLQHAYNSLEQRVDQGVKLREGISSVLGVEQNENISILTWLTIIYLGPALVTVKPSFASPLPDQSANHGDTRGSSV